MHGCYDSNLFSFCSQPSYNFQFISDGNPKLLSTFEDFCSTGKGACIPCEDDVYLSSTADDYDRGLETFYSERDGIFFPGGGDIIATNKLSGNANITYSAGGAVLLQPGFEVSYGAVFKTEIVGCFNGF